jgi:hypothetical protein
LQGRREGREPDPRPSRRTLRKHARWARDARPGRLGDLINIDLWIEQNGSSPGRARALPLWLAVLRVKGSALWTNRKAFAGKGAA